MHRIVLLRYGESVRNSENRPTGLSGRGCEEARAYGRMLKAKGFDMAKGLDCDRACTDRRVGAKAAGAQAANQGKAL